MNVKYLGSALALGSVVSLGVACGDSGSEGGAGGSADTSGTTASSGGGTKTTSTTSSVTVTSSSTGSMLDGNDTIDTAEAMTEMNGILVGEGELREPGTDVDFFKFTVAEAGVFLIQVRGPNFADLAAEDIDPYLSLYDSSKAVYAVNDDRYPRTDKQSEIITYLPAAGEYYLELREWCTSPTMDPMFCNQEYFDNLVGLEFAVAVLPMVSGTDYDAETAEPNNTLASATPITASPVNMMPGSYYLGIAKADFQMAGDADWFTVTIPDDLDVDANTRPDLGLLFPWGGIEGTGSKAKVGNVEVVDQATMSTIAKLDFTTEPNNLFDRGQLSIPVAIGGTYLVKVSDGGTETMGQGTFYFPYRTMGGGNPVETGEATNNVATTPDILASNPVDGGFAYFVEGNLGAADTDFFRVATQGKPEITVTCGGQRLGSGLRGLTATVFQTDGTTQVGTSTESATTDLLVDSAMIPAGQADLLVRMTANSQDPMVTGSYYRCGIYVRDAAP